MTDTEKVNKLKQVLSKQLSWYADKKKEEDAGEIDGSYIYDMAEEQFMSEGRSIFSDILETLAE